VAEALESAARQAGVEIRTGAEVQRIDTASGAVAGVVLAPSDQSAARAVISGVDPKRTLLGFVDPIDLEPDFIRHVQNIRAHGTLATTTYAAAALPRFAGLTKLPPEQQIASLSGRVRLAVNIDGIER